MEMLGVAFLFMMISLRKGMFSKHLYLFYGMILRNLKLIDILKKKI